MIFGPNRVDDHEKGLAGAIMAVFLQIGIITGVHFALILLFLIDPSRFFQLVNPS